MSLHLFSFKEAIPKNYRGKLDSYLLVSVNTTDDVLILRLLTSTINITSLKLSKSFGLFENYASFPRHAVARKSSKPIKAIFRPNNLSAFVKFSKKFYPKNINFYHNILQELTYYFHYTNEGNHQSAFVNLYRILEYVSYSFPLMHSSHFGNYIGSFESLRSYFTDAKTSEIKFFEKFVEKLFRGTPYSGLTTDFAFTCPDNVISDNCFLAFKNLNSNWTNADRVSAKLSIENKHLISLFKDVRNKYFHFAIGGQRNLQITDLIDPDFFFESINKEFLTWVGFIYATVLKESVHNSL